MGFRRYTVRIAFKGQIINFVTTDDEGYAMETERKMAAAYGKENVWIADAITELMVG